MLMRTQKCFMQIDELPLENPQVPFPRALGSESGVKKRWRPTKSKTKWVAQKKRG